ncbi:MAG: hypothetical protein DLM52_07915 [Chthoniobacterales bacterium]|nr:MAG: hypothetical protein DLM52_07915 [Chthoniobacterales bacterium]
MTLGLRFTKGTIMNPRKILLGVVCGVMLPIAVNGQTVQSLKLVTNHIISDPVSGMIYASVPSSAGTHGNSIATIDPSAGGYQPMFYAVTAAVIGGTAMLGGQGTVLGAFLGAIVLATLLDGLNVAGISANPLDIVFGLAILLSMIANVRLARLRAAGRT